MTEHKKDDGEVTLSCSVLKHDGWCRHTVEWLYEDKTVTGDQKDTGTSQSECSAVFTFPSSRLKQKPNYHDVLKCKMTNVETGNKHVFAFSPQSPGEKPGEIMMSCLKSSFITFLQMMIIHEPPSYWFLV